MFIIAKEKVSSPSHNCSRFCQCSFWKSDAQAFVDCWKSTALIWVLSWKFQGRWHSLNSFPAGVTLSATTWGRVWTNRNCGSFLSRNRLKSQLSSKSEESSLSKPISMSSSCSSSGYHLDSIDDRRTTISVLLRCSPRTGMSIKCHLDDNKICFYRVYWINLLIWYYLSWRHKSPMKTVIEERGISSFLSCSINI